MHGTGCKRMLLLLYTEQCGTGTVSGLDTNVQKKKKKKIITKRKRSINRYLMSTRPKVESECTVYMSSRLLHLMLKGFLFWSS